MTGARPKSPCPRRAHAVWALLAAAACSATPPSAAGDGPLRQPPSAMAPHIDVRRLRARPRLTMIGRQGDPAPALVVALATGLDAVGNTALAALVAERLARAGHHAAGRGDGAAVRLTLAPAERPLAELLSALATALATPVSEREAALGAAARAVAALAAAPLDAAALAPIARCSAEAAVLARDARIALGGAAGARLVESWRQSGFAVERMSIAAVGDEEMAEQVLGALEDTAGWPRGPALTPPTPEETHGAYLSAALAPGAARLDVAMWSGDALAAVGAAERIGGKSALGLRLAALEVPWRLERVGATALGRGGCVRLRLTPEASLTDGAELVTSAARVLAETERELASQLRLATDPFVVTRDIIAAGRAQDAAERAAWWTLTTPAEVAPTLVSALGASAHGVAPSAAASPASAAPADIDAHLAERYREAVAAQPRGAAGWTIADRRHAVELGQGQLWVLIGNPCALVHEGLWDAGTTALSALTVAAQARPAGSSPAAVMVEPWVSAAGAGLIVHAGLARGDESGAELARRVGGAAGRAYAALPQQEDALATAKGAVLGQLGSPLSAAFFVAAEHLAPNHPSWLAPWGAPEGQAAVTLADTRQRWREVLRGPARVAVLANVDDEQATLAAREVDRWLLPEARHRPCAETATLEPPALGSHALPVGRGHTTVIVAIPAGTSSADQARARLFEAALDGASGLLASALRTTTSSWRVRLVGGERQAALVIALEAPRRQLATAKERLVELLGRLGAQGLSAEEHASARLRAATRQRTARAEPAERLAALWRGDPPAAEPEREEANRWAREHLAPGRLVVVSPAE